MCASIEGPFQTQQRELCWQKGNFFCVGVGEKKKKVCFYITPGIAESRKKKKEDSLHSPKCAQPASYLSASISPLPDEACGISATFQGQSSPVCSSPGSLGLANGPHSAQLCTTWQTNVIFRSLARSQEPWVRTQYVCTGLEELKSCKWAEMIFPLLLSVLLSGM